MDLSIIIPIYNSKQFIKECIYSIVKQDTASLKLELVFVDDGSTDGSIEYVKQLLVNYSINTVYLEQKNSGVSSARNYGLLKSNGKYICFLDSDDMFNEGIFNNVKTYLQDDFDAIFWPYQKKTDGGEIIKSLKLLNLEEKVYINKGVNFLEEILIEKKHWICTGSIIFSKDFLIENNFTYNIHYSNGEDQLFHFKSLLCAKKVLYIDQVFTTVLLRSTSVSRQFKISNFENVLALNDLRLFLKSNFGEYKSLLFSINEHILQNFVMFYNKGVKLTNFLDVISLKKNINNTYSNINNILKDVYKEYINETKQLNFNYLFIVNFLSVYGILFKLYNLCLQILKGKRGNNNGS